MRLSFVFATAVILFLPYLSAAVVDLVGNAEIVNPDGLASLGEWTGAHVSHMYKAGRPDLHPTILGHFYARYSPDTGKLCVMVRSQGVPFEPGDVDEHWVAVDDESNKLSGESPFQYSDTKSLYERCFTNVSPNFCSIIAHSNMFFAGDEEPQTVKTPETVVSYSSSPSICGDPHLQSWGGVKWDYHGECDLVAIRNSDFANGKGLELHVRTTRDHHYSFTNEAALKIGDDIFEVHSLSEYKLNGELGDYTNKTDTLGGFSLSHWHSGSRDNLFFHRHVLDLGETGEKIEIKTFENIVYVEVSGNRFGRFKGSAGLFGDADSGKLIGRDRETEYEPSDEYALEWQVRDTDPKLFSNVRAPVYPEKCYPPKKFIPRLGFLQAQKQAEELCAAWDGDKESCVFDVLASGNKDLAQFKVMDAEAKAAAALEEQ